MEKIPTSSNKNRLDRAIDLERAAKQRLTQTFFNYSGIIVSVFLMLVVVLAVTTNIEFELGNLADLGMNFFLLLFCSYAGYVLCTDTGERKGYTTEEYIKGRAEFEEWYETMTEKDVHCVLSDFCAYYIKEDLRAARLNCLVLAGVTYSEYEKHYMTLSNADIDKLSGKSEAQKKALKAANAVKPITLRAEQILGGADGKQDRSPLSISPKIRKRITFGIKFGTISLLSFGMVLIVLNSIEASPWITFVTICLKMGGVLYNCFDGYKSGYENIAVYTVEHMRQQVSLMKQALLYAERGTNDEKGRNFGINTPRERADC